VKVKGAGSSFWFIFLIFHVIAVFLVTWVLLQVYYNQAFDILPYRLFGSTPIQALGNALIPSIILLAINMIYGYMKLRDTHKAEMETQTKMEGMKTNENEGTIEFERFEDNAKNLMSELANATKNPATANQNLNVDSTVTQKPKTFDEILAEIIMRKISDLDVAPEITISNQGKYQLLGREWDGKVSLTIKRKEERKEKEEEGEEGDAEDTGGNEDLDEGEKYNPF